VYISAPGEMLSVARIVRVELKDKYVLLRTTKEERFIFAFEDVLGLRLVEAPKDRAAGFAR
jgi:hypothetical protein